MPPARVRGVKRHARQFAQENIEPVAEDYFASGKYPTEVIKAAREERLVAQEITEDYGGEGRSLSEAVATAEEFFRADAGIGLALMGQSFGTGILEEFGTESQKEMFLRPVAEGNAIAGMAISEPETGSDLAGMETAAAKDDEGWVIDGEKYWIGNGVEADWILVYVRTEDNESRHDNHSLLVVPTNSKGYEAEHIPEKIGMHASKQSHITFEDCYVPHGNLIGKRGNGFQMVAEFFNHGRTRVAAQGVGLAAAAIEEAWKFVHDREEFGRSVSDFQSVKHDLAEMRTKFESARALLWYTVDRVESSDDAAKWAAMAKLHATETAAECAQIAIRLHGGRGILDNSRIGRIYRDVRMPIIYEGVSEIQRDIIYKNFS